MDAKEHSQAFPVRILEGILLQASGIINFSVHRVFLCAVCDVESSAERLEQGGVAQLGDPNVDPINHEI